MNRHGPRGTLDFSVSVRNVEGEDTSRSGGDRDFNDITVMGLKGAYDLTDGASAGFTLRRSWQEFGYDGTSWVPVADPRDYLVDAPFTTDRDEAYGSLWLEAETLGGRMLHRLDYSAMNQNSDRFNAGVRESDDRSTRRGLRYGGTYALDGMDARDAAHRVIVAAEAERETYRSSNSSGGTYERDTHALAAEYQGRIAAGIAVQAGPRREFNDVFRDATSWNVAAVWQAPAQDVRIRGAIGHANVNPDMFQQYGNVPGRYRGNPDLKPERSLNREVGVDLGWADGRGRASLTVFHIKVDDLIAGGGPASVNLNGSSTRKGFEASMNLQATDWLSLGPITPISTPDRSTVPPSYGRRAIRSA